MIMYHGYNFQRQLQETNLAVMKKKKTALSLYASKNRQKIKKKYGKRIGRPHTLKFPSLTKDHDITFGYEEEDEMLETDDEREMSLGEESFQFRVIAGANCQGVENMAGPPSSQPSSPSSSSSPSS